MVTNPPISIQVVLGTYSFMFSRKELDDRRTLKDPTTHAWTCLLRGRDPNLDLSPCIRKVVFQLHSSFPQPTRVVDSPPFQVEEVGWGEFEIACKIYLAESEEKPLEMKHYLKLYPDNTSDIRDIVPPDVFGQSPVVSETHDEIIFRAPSERMTRAVQAAHQRMLAPHRLAIHFSKGVEEDEAEYLAMTEMLNGDMMGQQEKLKQEIIDLTAEAQSLMNLHYALRPDRALQLLLSYPEALDLSSLEDPTKTELLEKMKSSLKTLPLTSNDLLSREKTHEVLNLYRQLVASGVITPLGLPTQAHLNI